MEYLKYNFKYMVKTIGFYLPHLDERGTGVAYYEYAYFNEKILGNKSIMFYDANDHRTHSAAKEKFEKDITLVALPDRENMSNLEQAIQEHGVDALYIQKCGRKDDGRYVNNVPMFIHVVGCNDDPHGIAYAYTSRWLSTNWSKGKHPYIPYIVRLPEHSENLRSKLNINAEAFVFGTLGGSDSFNISYAPECVRQCLEKRSNIYFIFANITPFMQHPRVFFLNAVTELNAKRMLINTCNAMLHCRQGGETFGMAVAEFSYCNKPVITFGDSPERAHIDHLGDKGVYYYNQSDLTDLLVNFIPKKDFNYNVFDSEYSPENVMAKFNKIFIEKII